MVQTWILVIGLAIGSGNSFSTVPKPFDNETDCRFAGQAWLDKIETLPNEQDQWDGKQPPKFLCFRIQ